jgi:hypothetical protein
MRAPVRIGLLLALVAAAALGAARASAAPRAYLGFLDDESLRWGPGRAAAWSELSAGHASVVRTIVDWREVAPRRPAHAADPFDPAYRFSNLDDFVRDAQKRGIEVLLTLWGTPGWANRGAGPNVPPLNPRDFGRFAEAVATRYSGHIAGYPFARFFSIWNEPNTPRFLLAADPVDAYARLAAAGYDGVKAVSPDAQVAIGETAASHAPAAFLEALAARDPKLEFDAWAHHPYPARPGLSPGAPEAWPDVGVAELGRLGDDVDRAFGRTGTPLWVTEYAESVPAVSRARQALDLQQAVRLAVAVPRVQMFVWLMLRNHRHEAWQSGLRGTPAWRVFRTAARSLDPRNGIATVASSADRAVLQVPALELRYGVPAGEYLSVSYSVRADGRRLRTASEPAAMGADGWVPVVVRLPEAQGPATVAVSLQTRDGAVLHRTLSVVRRAPSRRSGESGPARRPR